MNLFPPGSSALPSSLEGCSFSGSSGSSCDVVQAPSDMALANNIQRAGFWLRVEMGFIWFSTRVRSARQLTRNQSKCETNPTRGRERIRRSAAVRATQVHKIDSRSPFVMTIHKRVDRGAALQPKATSHAG